MLALRTYWSICDANALTTPSADKDCSIDVDNLSYRIDTSMEEDASPLDNDSTLLLAGERQAVAIKLWRDDQYVIKMIFDS